MAHWLLTNGKLNRNEEHHLFQQGIPTLLWAKLSCYLEITMPDHYPKDPYKVDNIFEAAKWIFKGTDTATSIKKIVAPIPGLITNSTTRTPAPIKSETSDAATNAIISMLACMEEHMVALLESACWLVWKNTWWLYSMLGTMHNLRLMLLVLLAMVATSVGKLATLWSEVTIRSWKRLFSKARYNVMLKAR